MPDGQLQLTASTALNALPSRSMRAFFWASLAGVIVLGGCASSGTRAPVVDLSNNPPPSTQQPNGTGYVVKPGDTLYKIARANNVEMDNLKRWNSLTDPNQLVVGQVLRLSANGAPPPSSGLVQSAPIRSAVTQPRSLESTENPGKPEGNGNLSPSTPLPAATGSATSQTPAITPTPPVSPHPAPAADAGVIKWGWPASGKVMEGFNANSKGIDIEGAAGDPVLAAADGKVMYAGNGVRGLGSLIIINHQNGFITAYAHNRTLLVKTGQEVKRGTKIAEIGQTDAPSPRLHFEVRRQGTPVDPARYLPPK
jgi:lipoprotein NlpD